MALTYASALLTIASSNLETLVNFYEMVLAQEPVSTIPGVYAEFHLTGLKLGIFRPRHTTKIAATERVTGENQGQTVEFNQGLGLCLEVENLEQAIAHLSQLGYPPGPIRTASHGWEVDAQDPDGNWIILHQSV